MSPRINIWVFEKPATLKEVKTAIALCAQAKGLGIPVNRTYSQLAVMKQGPIREFCGVMRRQIYQKQHERV